MTLTSRPGRARPGGRRARTAVGQRSQKDETNRQRIGLTLQSIDPRTAEANGLPTRGAVITEVQPGSPADAAELAPGMVVTEAAGKKIASADDLSRLLKDAKPGSTILLRVTDPPPQPRGEQLAPRPGRPGLARPATRPRVSFPAVTVDSCALPRRTQSPRPARLHPALGRGERGQARLARPRPGLRRWRRRPREPDAAGPRGGPPGRIGWSSPSRSTGRRWCAPARATCPRRTRSGPRGPGPGSASGPRTASRCSSAARTARGWPRCTRAGGAPWPASPRRRWRRWRPRGLRRRRCARPSARPSVPAATR